jgi:hypothetical protein
MIIKEHESESGHYYTKLGEPAYKIIGKNGNKRNTNVKDARELGLVPSVTTIIGQLAKPGLDRWKSEQLLLAALTLPRYDNEAESDWLERVMADSRSTGKEAAERGTRMHGVLENFYRRKEIGILPFYVIEVDRTITAHFGVQQWAAEASFASPQGYGGKIDLNGSNVVIDFKSKVGDISKVKPYHEQIMQLAAYRVGLGMPDARCANVYFNETGDVTLVEYTPDQLDDAFSCFQCLLQFYKIKNNL